MSTTTAMDLASFDASIRLGPAALNRGLRDLLGARNVAYIGGVSETRAVRQWAEGVRTPSEDVIQRLRIAYRASDLIQKSEGIAIAQVWFMGLNPTLDDASPASLIRNGELETAGPKVIAAAKTFVGDG